VSESGQLTCKAKGEAVDVSKANLYLGEKSNSPRNGKRLGGNDNTSKISIGGTSYCTKTRPQKRAARQSIKRQKNRTLKGFLVKPSNLKKRRMAREFRKKKKNKNLRRDSRRTEWSGISRDCK